MKIDISITNENYLEVGKKIQNAITKAFGEGSFSYNISKGKSNYSITHFDLPLKFIYPKHYKKDIFYDGGFYKGNVVTKQVVCSKMRGFVKYEGWCKLWKSGHE